MFGTIVQQDRNAVAMPVSVGAVEITKPAHLAGRSGVVDLIAVAVIGSVLALWRGKEWARAVLGRGESECVTYGCRLFDGNHDRFLGIRAVRAALFKLGP
jgi:hypothetical protein